MGASQNTGGQMQRARRRSAGEGTVYQDSEGRWRGSVSWINPDGTRGRRVVRGRTGAEARAKLDELRRDLRLGTLAPAGAVTVGDYAAGWLERHRSHVRPSTWATDELYVRRFIVPQWGRIALTRLTAADVERGLTVFVTTGAPGGKPIAPVTAGHVRATLRTALSAAQRDGLVHRNAATDARPPKVPHRDVTYLGPTDVRRLVEATRDDRLGPFWAVAVSTGLRRGEVLALRWSDVAGGRLTVRRSVGRTATGWAAGEVKAAASRRPVPLPAMATEALDRQRAQQDGWKAIAGASWSDTEGHVFTDEAGGQLQPTVVSHAFAEARIRAGIPPVRLHDLRHSAATMLLGAGVPMSTISAWLGHGDLATTARYYAAVTDQLRDEARDAMDRALATGE